MLELTQHADGVMLPVKAQTKASKNALRCIAGGMLKVSVTQVAEKGKANDAIAKVLADELGLRRSQIELVAGHTQPQKRFLIRGVTPDELRQKIVAAGAE